MIKKRWNLENMKIRLENLKKIISPTIVELQIWQALLKTNDELDALYLAYYDLKDMYLKYKRSVFGTVNQVDYKPKTNNVWTIKYNLGYYDIYNPSYDYIHYNDYDTVTTTNIVASTSTATSFDWSDYSCYFDTNQCSDD